MAGGRPKKIDAQLLQKLEEAFSMGCSDNEACILANIAPATLYLFQKANPEFVERKALLKENPILLARKTVFESLADDVNSAWKYLERKDKELNPKSELDVTSKGEKLTVTDEQLNQLIRARGARTDNDKSGN